jgi:hypothetical protein
MERECSDDKTPSGYDNNRPSENDLSREGGFVGKDKRRARTPPPCESASERVSDAYGPGRNPEMVALEQHENDHSVKRFDSGQSKGEGQRLSETPSLQVDPETPSESEKESSRLFTDSQCMADAESRSSFAAEVATKVEIARKTMFRAMDAAHEARQRRMSAVINEGYIRADEMNYARLRRSSPPRVETPGNIMTGERVPEQHPGLNDPTDSLGSRVRCPMLEEEYNRQRELEPLPASEDVAYHEQDERLVEFVGPDSGASLDPRPIGLDKNDL